jgi:hypothetical protein
MSELLKDIASNHEKLHRIQMIQVLTESIASYVKDIVVAVEEDFDETEDFEDAVTGAILRRVDQDLETLKRYL